MRLFLSLILLPSLYGCSVACNGTQADYDSAYDACFADGQADVCAAMERGTNYNDADYDICGDGLGDMADQGCEAGYGDGYDGGCDE